MVDRPGARRSPARYLAPVALVAVLLGTVLVIEHSTGGGTKHPAALVSHGRKSHGRKHRHATRTASARFYVVQPGDSMTSISQKTGIALGTLQVLNPAANPNSLQVGQRLRLRR